MEQSGRNAPARLIVGVLMCFLLATTISEALAQDSSGDTITTPFRKGRWLSGLNGTFNSSTLKLGSSDELFTTNSYGLEIFTGAFFKDRWFAGFNLLATSSNGAGLIERESESLLVGPSISYYFLKEPYGSLYVNLLPGYIRIREEGSVQSEQEVIVQRADGPGFATRMRLGYSYVISRRIVLDVGVGTTLSWLDVEYRTDLTNSVRGESVFSNSTFFSFGFNVLLDEFFF